MKIQLKNLILIILCCNCSVVNVSASELTELQKTAYSELTKFLGEEGFSAIPDNDTGTLDFKREGVLYWISVSKDGSFYSVNRGGLKIGGDDGFDYKRSLFVANTVNKNLSVVKAYCSDKIVTISYEIQPKSVEDFKYVLYKAINLLDTARKKFIEEYNNSSSNNTTIEKTPYDLFFPVYGISIGKTTLASLSNMGHTVKKYDSTSSSCSMNGLAFWDHNSDNVVENVYLTRYNSLPADWMNKGCDWRLSYNEWIVLLKKSGFQVEVKKQPSSEKYSKRQTLSAEILAKSSHLNIDLDFNYGNDNGEGHTIDSKSSLYSLTFHYLK